MYSLLKLITGVYNMSVKQLSWRLKRLRQQAGLSQQALASRATLSRNFLAQIERGESSPTVAVLCRLAQALGTTVGHLLGEEPQAGPLEVVPIPLVADRIAAGPPAYINDHIETFEPLPNALLASLGVNPSRVVLIRLGKNQDSMADTIPPGATVLVDRTPVERIIPRQIYAVREEAGDSYGCAIKRVVFDLSSQVLILLSDNPAHLPRAIRLRSGQSLSQIVLGRALWWMPRTASP